MKILTYRQFDGFGTWDAPEWHDGEQEDTWLKRCGYERSSIWVGDSSQAHLIIHDRLPSVGAKHLSSEFPYLVELGDVERHDYILVPDEASLLALKIVLAPLLMLNLLEDVQSLVHMGEKAFHVMHRHDYTRSCDSCDPRGAEQHREWRREQEKAKRLAEAQKKGSGG